MGLGFSKKQIFDYLKDIFQTRIEAYLYDGNYTSKAIEVARDMVQIFKTDILLQMPLLSMLPHMIERVPEGISYAVNFKTRVATSQYRGWGMRGSRFGSHRTMGTGNSLDDGHINW